MAETFQQVQHEARAHQDPMCLPLLSPLITKTASTIAECEARRIPGPLRI
jgi:hypothetical protein